MAKRQPLNVFDFAIRAEKEGIEFYTKAAKKFADYDMKNLFLKLAKEEAAHLKLFTELKMKADTLDIDQILKDPDIDDYMEAIIQEGLFPKGDTVNKRLERVDSPAAAAAVAMAAGERHFALHGTGEDLPERDQKKLFEKIVKEEKSHVVMVRNLRADHDPAYAALPSDGSSRRSFSTVHRHFTPAGTISTVTPGKASPKAASRSRTIPARTVSAMAAQVTHLGRWP